MKARTPDGYVVEQVSTTDRGRFYEVKTPYGSRIGLDPWNPQSRDEIRTLDQLKVVLERYGQVVPVEFCPPPEYMHPE